MKIVIDNGGQTCNKFWSYLAPIKHTIKTGEKILILFPDKDLAYYPNLLSNKHLKIFGSKLLSSKIPFKKQELFLRRICSNKYYDILPRFKKLFKKGVLKSWDDRFIILDDDTKQKALEILSPSQNIIEGVNDLFSKKREGDSIIIGTHIRGGDYRRWHGGKYFFTQKQFRDICHSLQQDFPNKKVLFFLASNEEIDKNIFSNPDEFFTLPHSNAAKDLYALSQCDYIIGPPSTFSKWAAFSGNKPISFIMSIDNITVPKKLLSFDRYEDNTPLPFDL